MKYIRALLCLLLGAALMLSLAACNTPPPGPQGTTPRDPIDTQIAALADPERPAAPSYGTFTVTTGVQNGVSHDGEVYTFTKGGEYTLSGHLQGRIVVNAPKEEKVKLILNGVYITCEDGAPIVCTSADELTLKSEENTYNVIEDDRPDVSTVAEDGAVYSKEDLTFSGRGILIIHTQAARGAHSSNDITVKNVTLKVQAVDTALRGDDSVTVESGRLLLISDGEDGIKTQNSDLSSKGKQRGDVAFFGGTTYIFAYGDGVQAVNDVLVQAGACVSIRCGNFGTYPPTDTPATDTLSHSARGIKADNALHVRGGYLDVQSTDDAVKTTKDTFLESGGKTLGDVSISGGFTRLRSDNDCLDITGNVTVSGGYLVLETHSADSSSTTNKVVGFKVVGSCSISGGTVLVFGGQLLTTPYPACTLAQPLPAGLYTIGNETEQLCFTLYSEPSTLCVLCPTWADGNYTLQGEGVRQDITLQGGRLQP